MRLVVARCQVDYAGRLTAHLPMATRLLIVKADGSVLGALRRRLLQAAELDVAAVQAGEERRRHVDGQQPGGRAARSSRRGGAARQPRTSSASTRGCRRTASRRTCRSCSPTHVETLGAGLDAGPPRVPDRRSARSTSSCRDASGGHVAVEIKRRGEIDGVEQLTRYLDLLNRDPLLGPVRGIFAAQEIKPQARVLATRPRHRLRRPSTTTRCAGSRIPRCACSRERHARPGRRRRGHRPELRRPVARGRAPGRGRRARDGRGDDLGRCGRHVVPLPGRSPRARRRLGRRHLRGALPDRRRGAGRRRTRAARARAPGDAHRRSRLGGRRRRPAAAAGRCTAGGIRRRLDVPGPGR